MKILKVAGYDKFKCIADKCKFTCCSGWDINIDNETYEKWNKKKECSYILDKAKFINNNTDIIVNKKTHEVCPLLDEIGLCEIVKNNGEEYLSLTCKMFPRIHNVFEDIKELTLSCACPEVVEIIANMNEKISLNAVNNQKEEDLPIEMKIRDTIVKIIQDEDLNLQHKLIISYEMLMNILNDDELTEESVLKELEKYQHKQYVNYVEENNNKEIDYKMSIRAINNLLIDFIENYKKVPVLKDSLKVISKSSMKIYRGEINIDELFNKWDNFNMLFNKYNLLVENCIVSKVLASCINDDIEEVALSIQLIILEYLLVRYSTFITMYIEESEDLMEIIKDNIVVFSRIIGNNSDTVIDFIEECFGDIFLDIEFLKKISM